MVMVMTTEALVSIESSDARIGRRVFHLMWDRKITQTELGRQLNIGQSSMSKKLRGERPWYTAELELVADLLEVSVGYLFGETKEAPTPKGEGHTLPDLDSNQEPAGFKPGELIRVDFGSAA